jgi:hypothetical protein
MDIGKAFSFVFDDESWVNKILIGGLISILLFIPLVNIAVAILFLGYTFETARNVAMNSPRPLPDWSNLGEKFRLGFGGFVVSLVYALPLIVIVGLLACVGIGIGAASGSEDSMAGIFALTMFCVVPLALLLGLVIAPFALAAMVRYLQTDSIGAALQFSSVIAMVRQDIGGWVVLWLLSILCSIVGSVGTWVIIGFIFTYPYSQAVFGHILGQKLQQLGRPAGYDYAPPAAPTF